MKGYKYNESKTLNWLAFKCSKLAEKLASNQTHMQQCASFVKSDKMGTLSRGKRLSSVRVPT